MARFEYRDKNGKNECNVESNVSVSKDTGTLHIGVHSGDGDGDTYTVYVPNHREKLFRLASEIFNVLELTKDWPEGYDGFSFNFGSADDSGGQVSGDENALKWENPGVARWYG